MTGKRIRKGFRQTVSRAFTLPVRYGLTPDRMRTKLRLMRDGLRCSDAIPTFHVTASALEAHPEFSKELEGCDVGMHGYHHIGYSGLSFDDQEIDLERAREVFSRCDLSIGGFRAPYLRADESTFELLRLKGFAYDSSVPTFGIQRNSPMYAHVAKAVRVRYGLVDSLSTTNLRRGGIVELPVSLPDDEILIDAMRLTNTEALTRIFNELLMTAVGSRSLLVLQLHPERFHLVSAAVRTLLRDAWNLGGWTAPLSEIASWLSLHSTDSIVWPNGHAFAVSISGDLDAISLGDFMDRFKVGLRWKF